MIQHPLQADLVPERTAFPQRGALQDSAKISQGNRAVRSKIQGGLHVLVLPHHRQIGNQNVAEEARTEVAAQTSCLLLLGLKQSAAEDGKAIIATAAGG